MCESNARTAPPCSASSYFKLPAFGLFLKTNQNQIARIDSCFLLLLGGNKVKDRLSGNYSLRVRTKQLNILLSCFNPSCHIGYKKAPATLKLSDLSNDLGSMTERLDIHSVIGR